MIDEKYPAHRKCSVNISCRYDIVSPILNYLCGAYVDWCMYKDYWQSTILLQASWGCRESLGCHFDLVCVYSQQKLIHIRYVSVAIGFGVLIRRDLEQNEKKGIQCQQENLNPHQRGLLFQWNRIKWETYWNVLPSSSGGSCGLY